MKTPDAVRDDADLGGRTGDHAEARAREARTRAASFASAYNVSTPPDQIVTSGPWKVPQYVPGEKTVLGRNPYWFGVDKANKRLPYLNELVFLIVPDQDAADLKFRAGELARGRQRQARELPVV